MVRPTFDLDTLPASLGAIFDQVQTSLVNHRKNCTALYKIQVQAASITESVRNGQAIKLTGERAFGDAFVGMVNNILVIKKGPPAADRVVKFIGSFVKHSNERALEAKSKEPVDEDEDTPASRFVSRLLKFLLQGFLAKDKIVRLRVTQIVSEMIAHLGELDEDAYTTLRECLTSRACDKESAVRVNVVISLSKLVGSEDPAELEAGQQSMEDMLLDLMASDPSAEVRRAALNHMPLSDTTLPGILARTRDIDTTTRKAALSVLITKMEPRKMSIANRENVIQEGLGAREPVLRTTTKNLVLTWYDSVCAEKPESSTMDSLVEYLRLFDVLGPGEGVAVDSLLAIFEKREDLLNGIAFDGDFWVDLFPESMLLARVFVDRCLSTDNEDMLEQVSLPVATAFAFRIQEVFNTYLELTDGGPDEDEEAQDAREDDMANGEFIVGELLAITAKLDYTDEVGRRKVFAIIRDMLAHRQLPENLIQRCMDVLRAVLPDEKELIRVVVEVILDLRDEDDMSVEDIEAQTTFDDTQATKGRSLHRKTRAEMTPEESKIADATDMRCLTLCIAMLERVHGAFEDNSTLEGVLTDLIIPAVKRKEMLMRQRGLTSLGLCCLIASKMATNSFQLFVNQIQTAPEDLKLRCVEIVFDLLMVHDDFLGRTDDGAQRIITFLLQTLENEHSKIIEATLTQGLCKLLLAGKIVDTRVLQALLIVYVSPATADNTPLRQCLSYFFPAYCTSAPVNQTRVQSIFMTSHDLILDARKELEEDETMIDALQFGIQMIDWTNPLKVVVVDHANLPASAGLVHANLAVDILKGLYDSDREDDDVKTLIQLLGHLHLPHPLEPLVLHKLNILLTNLDNHCTFSAANEKLMTKFKTQMKKKFGGEVGALKAQNLNRDESVTALYEFIGVGVPIDEENGREDSAAPSAASRRSSVAPSVAPSSRAPSVTASSRAPSAAPSSRAANLVSEPRKLSPGKRRAESEEEDEAPHSPTPTPRRSNGKGKEKVRVSKSPPQSPSVTPTPQSPQTSAEEQEEEVEEKEPSPEPAPATPVKRPTKRARPPPAKAEPKESPVAKRRTTRAASKPKPPPKARVPAAAKPKPAPKKKAAPAPKRTSSRKKSIPEVEEEEEEEDVGSASSDDD